MFVVPTDAIIGCYVPVSVVVNKAVSNFASIAIAPADSSCSDGNGMSSAQSAQVQQLTSGGTNVRVGSLSLTRVTSSPDGTTTDSGSASFGTYTPVQMTSSLGPLPSASAGGCLVFPLTGNATSLADPVQPQGINAGSSVGIKGPNGSANISQPSGTATGVYAVQLAKSYLDPGAYTITSTDGDVGAITGQLNVPVAVTWANAKSITSIDRTQGVTVMWTGGDPSSFVTLSGASSGAMFTCTAPASVGTLTVPPSVTQALPASTSGRVTLLTVASSSSFTAPGIDVGVATGSTGVSQPVVIQ